MNHICKTTSSYSSDFDFNIVMSKLFSGYSNPNNYSLVICTDFIMATLTGIRIQYLAISSKLNLFCVGIITQTEDHLKRLVYDDAANILLVTSYVDELSKCVTSVARCQVYGDSYVPEKERVT